MKKLATIILAVLLGVALVGCGGKEEPAKEAVKQSTPGKIPYQKYQVMKAQFKQINDMFVYDPINDEIITAMAKPDEFKGDRGTQLVANLKNHETKLVGAKRFFEQQSDIEKVNKYNQLVLEGMDKKIQAFVYAEAFMRSKNSGDKNFFVKFNSEAIALIDQANTLLIELQEAVE